MNKEQLKTALEYQEGIERLEKSIENLRTCKKLCFIKEEEGIDKQITSSMAHHVNGGEDFSRFKKTIIDKLQAEKKALEDKFSAL